jgi:hypothetical protein
MNIKLFFTTVFATFAMQASADNYLDTEVLTVEVPEMKAELVDVSTLPANSMSLDLATTSMNTVSTTGSWKPDFDFFKSKTNPGVKPYKFMDDMTFAGIPLFVAGLAVKGDKAMFRVNNDKGKKNTQLLTNFKTGIDDYSQFFGPAMVVGLKLGGYEGRSDWPRLLASAGMSYGIMALLVNGIKYTAKEMRPDGSSANSWPSGHTATAFVGATLLHKEYGLTRSPWFSVAGYGVAAATGVMRVLNNRHWVSDVMSGAGIGIMSAELGYALCDLLFKGKGLLRNDLKIDSENPSFFSISMGVGVGAKDVSFGVDDMIDIDRFSPADIAAARAAESEEGKEIIEFRHATVVDGEGAYFFNKYIGVGGRLRVRAMSAKSFDRYADLETMAGNSWDAWDVFYKNNGKPQTAENYEKWDNAMWGEDLENGPIKDMNAIVESDHLTEFSASVGLYLNLPLSKHFSLGTKLLIGRSFMQEMDIDGVVNGKVKDMDYQMTASSTNGVLQKTMTIEDPTTKGDYDYTWDYLTLGADNSTTWGTGLSLTYRYKSNFSWKVFVDYDYSKKDFTLKYDPLGYMRHALTTNSYLLAQNIEELSPYLTAEEYKRTKKMNYFTLGLSFMVNL